MAQPREAGGRAHPRSRGENIASRKFPVYAPGSSPLTRGKRQPARRARRPKGLIPAHAGKTFAPTPSSPCSEAHPRSRGENAVLGMISIHENGSSPLTRGKLRERVFHVVKPGLIPAHAGKTTAASMRASRSSAHPRSRGENLEIANPRGEREGSSPLTRGKRAQARGVAERDGLIPAHAGKTQSQPDAAPDRWAHPRSRGENSYADKTDVTGSGSSPLTRGKQQKPLAYAQGHGLIPAHAGKTGPRWLVVSRGTAHPRSRGENSVASGCSHWSPGSSPLTRGKRP